MMQSQRFIHSADVGPYEIGTVIFDLEGTVVKEGSYNTLFEMVGAGEEHADMLRRGLANEFTSLQDLNEEACDILRSRGLTRKLFYENIKAARLTKGAEYVCKTLKMRGYKTGMITGGFEALAQRVKGELCMDFYAAACCDVRFDNDGSFVGWSLKECDYDGKVERLRALSKIHDFRIDKCAYVGDGEGDVAIMKEVALPIAFNPKTENVRKAAKEVVEGNDMRKILKYFPPITIG